MCLQAVNFCHPRMRNNNRYHKRGIMPYGLKEVRGPPMKHISRSRRYVAPRAAFNYKRWDNKFGWAPAGFSHTEGNVLVLKADGGIETDMTVCSTHQEFWEVNLQSIELGANWLQRFVWCWKDGLGSIGMKKTMERWDGRASTRDTEKRLRACFGHFYHMLVTPDLYYLNTDGSWKTTLECGWGVGPLQYVHKSEDTYPKHLTSHDLQKSVDALNTWLQWHDVPLFDKAMYERAFSNGHRMKGYG